MLKNDNIGDFFDLNGIIHIQNVDDIIKISNELNPNYYEVRKEVIDINWKTALSFINYENRIVNEIINLFKLNNII